MSTQLLLWLDVVGSVIVIIGFVFAAARWGRRIARGVSRWIDRVGDNTAATRQLTGVVAGVRDDIRSVAAAVSTHRERLDLHERRLDGHDQWIAGHEKGELS